MMALTRSALLLMISVRRRSSGPMTGDSASSWPAWLMAPTGLRISCAMLADKRPSAASLLCCTRSAISVVSSRNISVGPGGPSPSGAKYGWMTRPPSAATKLSGVRSRPTPLRQVLKEYSSRGETSPSNAPGTARALPMISAAEPLIRRMLSPASTTSRLSRRCCRMYCESSAMLARSTSFCMTRASLSRIRPAMRLAAVAIVKSIAPSKPAEVYAPISVWPLTSWPVVTNSTPSVASAARNSALRVRSTKERPPTGTRYNNPRLPPTPPQICRIRVTTHRSTVICAILWNLALPNRRLTSTTLSAANTA